MAARIGNITFDCGDVLKLATFWSAVLGRPVDKGSSEFFASIGGADGERREPAWYFNKVPEPRQAASCDLDHATAWEHGGPTCPATWPPNAVTTTGSSSIPAGRGTHGLDTE